MDPNTDQSYIKRKAPETNQEEKSKGNPEVKKQFQEIPKMMHK